MWGLKQLWVSQAASQVLPVRQPLCITQAHCCCRVPAPCCVGHLCIILREGCLKDEHTWVALRQLDCSRLQPPQHNCLDVNKSGLQSSIA
jgi:hypothetical protein